MGEGSSSLLKPTPTVQVSYYTLRRHDKWWMDVMKICFLILYSTIDRLIDMNHIISNIIDSMIIWGYNRNSLFDNIGCIIMQKWRSHWNHFSYNHWWIVCCFAKIQFILCHVVNRNHLAILETLFQPSRYQLFLNAISITPHPCSH